MEAPEAEQGVDERENRRKRGLGKPVMLRQTKKATPDEVLVRTGTTSPLLTGTQLTCPACEKEQNILAYKTLEHSVKYADQIVVPLKCRSCRHVFALKP